MNLPIDELELQEFKILASVKLSPPTTTYISTYNEFMDAHVITLTFADGTEFSFVADHKFASEVFEGIDE